MKLNKTAVIVVIAFIVGLISILTIIIGIGQTAPGWQYLATGHYYLDYFTYLQAIAQGYRGHFLYSNPYATDDPGTTFLLWWPYLLLGHIARYIHLSPITVYWLAVFILNFITVILIYQLISRLIDKESFTIKVSALLLSLFSTGFLNIFHDLSGNHLSIADFWYAPSNLFKRLSGVPHHLLGEVLVLTVILIAGNGLRTWKRSTATVILLIATLTFYPYQVINLVIALLYVTVVLVIVSNNRSWRNLIMGIISLIFVGLAGIVIRSLSTNFGLISRLNQSDIKLTYYPSLFSVLFTIGPLLIFAPIGLKDFLQKMSPTKLLLFSYIIVSWTLTFSPLASYFNNFNLRFLSPLSVVFFATAGILGIKKIPWKYVRNTVTAILLLYFLAVTTLAFNETLHDPNIFSPITYLPQGVIAGYRYLDTFGDDKAVLTTPSQLLGTVLPIFADRKVYIGRHVFTPDYINRANFVNQFYLHGINNPAAENFLMRNNIGYVVLTSIEGYSMKDLEQYPFLKNVYHNKDITMFKYVKVK